MWICLTMVHNLGYYLLTVYTISFLKLYIKMSLSMNISDCIRNMRIYNNLSPFLQSFVVIKPRIFLLECSLRLLFYLPSSKNEHQISIGRTVDSFGLSRI